MDNARAGDAPAGVAGRLTPRQWGSVFVRAFRAWQTDNAFKHSAAVSFYTLFSLAPITLIVLAVSGFFLGKEVATRHFSAQLGQLVGAESARLIQEAVAKSEPQREGWSSAVIGLVTLFVGATTVFAQLQDSLNAIWSVMAKPSRNGLVLVVVQRLISFAMVLSIGFLLLVSLAVTTALTGVARRYGADWSPQVMRIADFVVALGVISLLFSLLFKVLPDVRLRWSDVWIGGVLTALLFDVGRLLIALYLAHSTLASTYGAAGSLVALLVWVYYSAAILFFGAEWTRACCEVRGRVIEPKDTAVRVRREIVETADRGAETRPASSA